VQSLLTERCTLATLKEVEFDELVPLYTNGEVCRYLGGVRSVEKSMAGLQDSVRDENSHSFTVRLKATKELLGIVFISPHHNLEDMEISYMFLPKYWGNGYARESVKALLDFCKNELKLKQVVSETQTANKNSRRLLEVLGYKIESELERFGATQTIYVYSFTDEERQESGYDGY